MTPATTPAFPSTMCGVGLLVRGFFVAWGLAAVIMTVGPAIVALSNAQPGLPTNTAGIVALPIVFVVFMGFLGFFWWMGATTIPTGFDLGDDRLIVHRWRDDEWTIKYSTTASVQVRSRWALFRGASSWGVRSTTPMGMYWHFQHAEFGDTQVFTRGHRDLVVVRLKDGTTNAFAPDDAAGYVVALEATIASDGERRNAPIPAPKH